MKRRWRWILLALGLLVVAGTIYVRTHPLVFMDTHVYCIQCGRMALSIYAEQNDGRFPYHPKGYPNALLLVDEESLHCLTGPGYDPELLREAKRTGRELTEAECGRVYVQGLTKKSNWKLALLFDKLPTPGGDHCHMPFRLFARLSREVVTVGGDLMIIRESEWPDFAKEQVHLLVEEGFDRREAERLFASEPEITKAVAEDAHVNLR